MRKMMPIRIVGKYVWSVWKLWRGVWNYYTHPAPIIFFWLSIFFIYSGQGQGLPVGV